ncbi:MAG: DNA-formamidopyrimidine glycosylase family protein [Chloroflexota bacterium]
MTIEMPEAAILGRELDPALRGRTVATVTLRGCEKLQRIGFINRDLAAFDRLIGAIVERVATRGNTIIVKLSGGHNLIISPEYGGEVLLHASADAVPPRHHVRVDFDDGSVLTVWIKIMGGMHAIDETGLAEHYVVKRDFDLSHLEPLDPDLTLEAFGRLLAGCATQLKPVLVGRDAVVVGLGNSTFQDVLFRARLHPRRRACDLRPDEVEALYAALRLVVEERLRLGGKASFVDLYGRAGGYEPAMGAAFKGRACPACDTPIERLALGGGEVYLCPACQPAGG